MHPLRPGLLRHWQANVSLCAVGTWLRHRYYEDPNEYVRHSSATVQYYAGYLTTFEDDQQTTTTHSI